MIRYQGGGRRIDTQAMERVMANDDGVSLATAADAAPRIPPARRRRRTGQRRRKRRRRRHLVHVAVDVGPDSMPLPVLDWRGLLCPAWLLGVSLARVFTVLCLNSKNTLMHHWKNTGSNDRNISDEGTCIL